MSNTVDERIVEMRFDNQQFENNVQTSLSTIDKLKQSLNFTGATKGLENVGEATKNCNMSILGEAVQTVHAKFSAFGIMGVTALVNITNAAVNAGKKIVNALTLEPVMSGFQEYETQINAVQTILANTQNGVTKVNQKAIESIKETAITATATTKQANEKALSDFKETQSEKLDEFKKNQSKELDALNYYSNEELTIINDKYEQEYSDLEKAIDDELTALSNAHDEKLKMYDEEYKEKLKVVDEERYNKLKAIDDEIASIQDLTKAEEKELKQAEQAKKLESLQKAVKNASDTEERKKAEEELKAYKDKLTREQLLEERNNKITALRESKDAIKEEYKATEELIKNEYFEKTKQEKELYTEKYKNLSTEATEKKKALNANYEAEKVLLQEQIDYVKEALKEKQSRELEAFQKQQKVELEGLKEKQSIALANIQERQNAEIKAINASAKATKGSTLEDVNKALAELNTYADKTIYNFTEMTRNIGTFTAAGVDLDTSVAAIKGIANLAAVSGSTSQQASTAMYQLSQALASGTVKLQDWNSVVNAGMGGQVFQDALKETARVHGVAIDEMISQEGSFRETLSNGWLTSDILTETLSKFTDDLSEAQLESMGYSEEQIKSIIKMGQTANDAATKVKTFTQLFDTLKEAAQSGWTQSWQTIVGDFEEAKELLTSVSDVVSNMIQVSADARNAILSDWKELGGRTKIIDAIRNAFNAVLSIITPVKEAFSDVFPPITGQQLADLSSKIENITSKFILSDETADKVYRTFSGLFAIFDMVGQVISVVADSLSPLPTLLYGYGDGILDITSKMGDWLVKLDETLKKNNTFKNAVENVVDFIKSIPEKINDVFQKITGISLGDAFDKISQKASDALSKLKEVFSGFGKVDTSGIDTLATNVETRYKPIEILFGGIQKVFEGLLKFFEYVSPIFGKLATILGNALGSIGDAFMNAIGDADFSKILDIVNGGVLIAIGTGIKKFMDSLTSVTENAGGILGQIKSIFEGIQGCLESWQQNLKAGTLLKIAEAIGILTASVLVLSMIDSAKLTAALTAMTAEFIDLFAVITVFETVFGSDGFKGMKNVTKAMIPFAASVLILSFAMKTIADLDWGGVIKGLISVTALCTILTNSAKQLSDNNKKMMKGATGLIAFALAIKMLVGPVKELGALDVGALSKGLIGVGVLCAELALFLKGAKLDDTSLGKGLGLMVLAQSINILATAVGKFSQMDADKMFQGLAGVATVLTGLVLFIQNTGDASKVISTSIGLTILGAAMLIFGKAIESLGNLSIEQIVKGLSTMMASLGTIAITMEAMPNNLLFVAAGIGLIGVSLKIVASAMNDIGDMSWEEIAKGLGSIIGSLSMMAVATNAMSTALPGAAAILVVSGALAILAPTLKSFGEMSLTEIGSSLLALAGAFTVIGVAGLVLTPIIPVIIALAGVIALLSVGVLACGAGVLALSAGLSALAVSGAAGIGVLVLAVKSILSLIPQILIKLGEGIVAIIVAIGNAAPELATAVYKIVTALAIILTEAAPLLSESVLTCLDELLSSLADHLPSIIQSGMDISLSFLKGIRDNIGEMTTIFIDIIIETLEAIANKMDDIVQTGIDLVVAFIDGLAKGIEENTPRIKAAFIHLFEALLNSVKEFLGIHSPSTVFADIGDNLIRGLINGIDGLVDSAVSTITNMAGELVLAISNKVSEFKTKGGEFMINLKKGISDKLPEVKNAATDVITKTISGVKEKISEFKDIGKNIVYGLKEGISDASKKVIESADNVANNVVDTAKKAFGINSPSKVFAEIGRFNDEGLAKGLLKYASKVSDASESVSCDAINSASNVISSISDVLNSDIDTQPTIRPVLNLTDVTSGIRTMNKSLNANRSIELAGKTNITSGLLFGNNQNEMVIKNNNGDVIKAIDKLRNDMSDLVNSMHRLQVVLDTGTLVGEIAPKMDKALGVRSTYTKRGI